MKTNNKKVKDITAAAFKKMYLHTTAREMAAQFGVTRGAIIYHAKRLKITHIKKSGRAKRLNIIMPKVAKGME